MARRFKPVEWSYSSNIYEVNVRQYTPEGTFNAFAAHLPRLRSMGVEVLWLMPVTPISKKERLGSLGSYYACADYTAVNPEFGTLADFKNLVNQAQGLGFKVIIDWVANHTGWDHVWTQTHPEFYKKNAEGKFYDNHGWKDVIDLNYYDHTLRKTMIEAMAFWVKECNLDGFRCDMAHLVPLDFWRQARQQLDILKPLFWLGETEDMQYLDVFDVCYAWKWMHQTEQYTKGQITLPALTALVKDYEQLFRNDIVPLFFTTNHDENSWNGTEYEKYGGAAMPLAVFTATWYGIPLIYSGQELPNVKRLKFFDKDSIEWSEPLQLQEFYKKLLQLRLKDPVLSAGAASRPTLLATNADQAVLAFARAYNGKELLVLLNLSAQAVSVQVAEGYTPGAFLNIFDDRKENVAPTEAIRLPAWGFKILSKR